MTSPADESFSAKLAFVMKALSISRGRLAADVGVDKSVISRWVTGVYTPSGENLSQLNRVVAARKAGFSGLDWDRNLAALSAMFGGSSAPAAGHSLLPAPNLSERTAAIARGFEGYWLAWRCTFQSREMVLRDVYRLRSTGGPLKADYVTTTIRGSGPFTPADRKAHMTLFHSVGDVPTQFLLYTAGDEPPHTMDGLVLSITALAGSGLVAAPMVHVRYADLALDQADDDRMFAALTAERQLFERDEVDPQILKRLEADFSNDWLIRMGVDASLARYATPKERHTATERTAAFLATGKLVDL